MISINQKIMDPDIKGDIEIQLEGIGSDATHVVDAKFPVGDKIISFQFIEKFKVTWDNNIIRKISRAPYALENSNSFKEAFAKAYDNFQKENQIYYVYRHYGPLNKLGYSNSKLIGCTTEYDKINQMMKDDYEKFMKEERQECRFTYSISIGACFYHRI